MDLGDDRQDGLGESVGLFARATIEAPPMTAPGFGIAAPHPGAHAAPAAPAFVPSSPILAPHAAAHAAPAGAHAAPVPGGAASALAPAFGGASIAPRHETVRIAPAVPSAVPPGAEPRVATLLLPAAAPEAVRAPIAASPEIVAAPVAAVAPRPVAAPPPAPAAALPPLSLDGPLLPGPIIDEVDEDRLARPTVAERILFVLAFLLPPIGLIGSLIAAVRSDRRRGWVIGLVRAGVAVGVVLSIAAGFGAYAGYKALRAQQAFDQTAAASAAFCAAFAKDPALGGSDGGWPQPAASIPDSITAMQAFVDRWTALAATSPDGIRQGVAGIAGAGTEIIGSVTVQRTVDDAQNRQVLSSAVAASGVPEWRASYCG